MPLTESATAIPASTGAPTRAIKPNLAAFAISEPLIFKPELPDEDSGDFSFLGALS